MAFALAMHLQWFTAAVLMTAVHVSLLVVFADGKLLLAWCMLGPSGLLNMLAVN